MRASDQKLHAALSEAGLPELAARAGEGEFNDYFSAVHALPKNELVGLLAHAAGARTEDLINRVIQGEFDSGAEESDEWMASEGGQAMLRQLAADTPLTDPRELGGEIAGPGGPFDFGESVLDTRRAILVDYNEICKVDPEGAAGQDDAYALLIAGRINRSTDRAKAMVLGNLDFLASLITQCHGVAERAGQLEDLKARCAERWKEMPHR